MNAGYAVAEETSWKEEAQAPKVKKKKMGFVKRWLLKSVKEAVAEERSAIETQPNIKGISTLSKSRDQNIDQPERAINFTVYTATGGRVIETRKYDRKTDRNTTGLYIITNEMDFGREIDKIITMEALK